MKKEKIQYIFIYIVVTLFVLSILGTAGYIVYKEIYLPKSLNKEVSISDETKKQYLDRIKEAEKKLKEKDSNKFDLYMEIGNLKNTIGDISGSIEAYENAGKISPKNYPSFYSLGNIYTDLKLYEKAQENYLKAVENSPESSQLYISLSDLYKLDWNGKKYDTESILLKGLENIPEQPDILIRLALYYREKGEREKAIEYYKRHLAVNPNNEAAKNELAEMEKIKP